MRIAVDLDGTLAQTHEVFLEELEKRHGVSHSLGDIRSWYFENVDFSTDTFHSIARENWRKKDIPLTDEEIPEHLEELRKRHTVDVVTARDDVPGEELKNWLENKKVPFDSFKVDKEKTHLDYDFLVDDSPTYIGNGMKILLYHRPYNSRTELREKDERVEDFSEVRRHVEKIATDD
jgi:5'(3')-deoxyribonucleotidase